MRRKKISESLCIAFSVSRSKGDNMSLIMFVLGVCEACGLSLCSVIYTIEDTNEDPLLDFLDLGLMKDK